MGLIAGIGEVSADPQGAKKKRMIQDLVWLLQERRSSEGCIASLQRRCAAAEAEAAALRAQCHPATQGEPNTPTPTGITHTGDEEKLREATEQLREATVRVACRDGTIAALRAEMGQQASRAAAAAAAAPEELQMLRLQAASSRRALDEKAAAVAKAQAELAATQAELADSQQELQHMQQSAAEAAALGAAARAAAPGMRSQAAVESTHVAVGVVRIRTASAGCAPPLKGVSQRGELSIPAAREPQTSPAADRNKPGGVSGAITGELREPSLAVIPGVHYVFFAPHPLYAGILLLRSCLL